MKAFDRQVSAHKHPGSRWSEVIHIVTLALLPWLFFWRLLTPNPDDRMSIAAGDFTEQYFPLRAFTSQEWVRGQIPLWNPYLYGGQPALADIQSGALYPPHLVEALLLGWGSSLFGSEVGFPLRALEWQVIVHFSLATVGAFLFGRHYYLDAGASLRLARFGGTIAALVFTYCGYLTGFPVQQMTILAVSAWLPWILWGLSSALGQWSKYGSLTLALKPVAWAGLAFAMAILAGHPQTTLYIFYLTLVYTLFQAFYMWRAATTPQIGSVVDQTTPAFTPLPDGSPMRRLALITIRFLTLWLTVVLLGSCMAAAQLWPTLEFIAYSLRADLSYEAVSHGLPLNELISIIYPGFLGGSPQYVGIVSLVLIALALVLACSRFRFDRRSETRGEAIEQGENRPDIQRSSRSLLTARYGLTFALPIFFWAGTGLMSLLLTFGGNLFVYPLFYLFAPGWAVVRQQERLFLVYSFSAAVLAGFGGMALTGPLPKTARRAYTLFENRLRLVAGVALGLTAFYLYGATTATARGDEVNLFFGVLQHHLFGLMILGGFLVLLALRPRRRLRRWWGMGLLATWLTFSLFTANWRFNLENRPASEMFIPDSVVRFLQANLATGNAVDVPGPGLPQQNLLAATPMTPSLGRVVSGGLLPGGHNAASVYNLQDLTGNTPLQLATVEAFLQRMPAWRMWQLMNVRYIVARRDIADAGLSLVFEEGEVKVFRMSDPFNRAWLVSEVEVMADLQQALERLSTDSFDLRRAAIIAAPLSVPLADASASTIAITDFRPTYLDIGVEAGGSHLLVLSQIYYPGWQVKIDDQPAELLQVNVVQQGVVVPPGKHQVELTFWPKSFMMGVIASSIGVFIWVCLILVASIKPVYKEMPGKVVKERLTMI